MSDPVTVFLLVVSGLLVVGTVGEQIFARTGVPAVVWLILLGILVRVTGIVTDPVITLLAPFFAALALVLILFDAGRSLTLGADGEGMPAAARKRALLLALGGFAGTMLVVALLSMGLWGLNILPAWGWTQAFMLGSLVGAGAGEVFVPSLQMAGVDAGHLAVLRREAAITKALAVAGTVLFMDLVSPRVAVGGAGLAVIAGFGFALAFGVGLGVAWIAALQGMAGNPRSYMYTLAMMLALYVLSESAGGSGPLSVLVFGVTLGNAEKLLALMRRRTGAPESAEQPATTSVVHAALADHEATIGFVRTLVFAMVGLMLVPSGALIFGVVLGFLPLVVRLLVTRFALASSDHAERAMFAGVAPRGMATVALATLPLAHGVAGSPAMVTMVFSAVATSVVVFTVGLRHGKGAGEAKAPAVKAVAAEPGKPAAAVEARAPTLPEAPRGEQEGDTDRLAPPVTPVTPVAGLPAVRDVPVAEPARTPTVVAEPPRTPTEVAGPPVAVAPVAEPARAPNTTVPYGRVPAPAEAAVVAAASAPRPRAPLVGMQEQPTGGVSAAIERDLASLPTLPTIDAAKAHGENPLETAMMRALSKRPKDITAVRARPTTTPDIEAPPPSFTPFEGASEDDTTNVLAALDRRSKEPDDDTTKVHAGREKK